LCEVLRVNPSYLIYGEEMPFQERTHALHFGGVADTYPEFIAKATYCFSKLDAVSGIVLVQMMMSMLRSEFKSFDKFMELQASDTFFKTAKELQAILKEKEAKKKV